jgi:AraC-like DNA-binding protein
VSEVVYPSNTDELRRHCSRARLSFVLAGASTRFGNSGRARTGKRHALLVAPPRSRHRRRGAGAGAHCLCVDVAESDLPVLGAAATLWSRPACVDGSPLAGLVRRVVDELHVDDAATPLALHGLCMELVAGVQRLLARSREATEPPWLDEVIALLRNEYATGMTTSAMAHRVGLDPGALRSEFRKYRGESLSSFLRGVRVERACELLRASDLALADVALGVGFYDQSHLTRVFRRCTGMTPGAYRSAWSAHSGVR